MDKKLSKVMAVAVVSLFCVAAFAAVFISDDSSADGTVNHRLYIEMIGPDALVSSSQWMYFTSNGTPADFATKASAAITAYGIDDVSFSYTEGDYLTVNCENGNSACYYVKDGAWVAADKTAQEYPSADIIGLAIGGWISKATYDSLTDANKAKYNKEGGFSDTWYAIKLLDAKVTDAPAIATYHIFLELFTDAAAQELCD